MSSRDVGFVLRFIIPLILLGVLIALGDASRNADSSPNPSRWSLPLRIFESSKAAARNIPYFWYSLTDPKSTWLFGSVAVGGTILLGFAIWIGMKELNSQSLRETNAQEGENGLTSEARSLRLVSLKWKIPCAFAGITALLGLFVVASVYRVTGGALRSQLDQQAKVVATNLSDSAAAYVIGRNFGELSVLLSKYTRLDGVAYAFIEDSQGQIVAYSPQPFPTELRDSLLSLGSREVKYNTMTFADRPVYEIRLPILEGTAGVTHVGIWEDTVKDEIYRAIFPIVGLITIVLFAGVIFSAFLARSIVRPIRHLTDAAATISLGKLDTPINIDTRDEIGELASSVERMRASLKAAMRRLSGRQDSP